MHNPHKGGLFFGAVLGGVHVVWALLIALGWAQSLINFSFWAHMIHLNVVIGPFDATAALTVIVVAAIIGYVVGYLATLIWNRVNR